MIEHEPHEPIADCDCRECAVAERNRLRQEVTMLRQEYAADTVEIAEMDAKIAERIAKGRDAALSRRVPLERRVGRQTVKRSDDG